MKTLQKLRIDYRYQNWGKTERVVCEQENQENLFTLLKAGQVVGTIQKTPEGWKASTNAIFLPEDVVKIGNYIDEYRKKNGLY